MSKIKIYIGVGLLVFIIGAAVGFIFLQPDDAPKPSLASDSQVAGAQTATFNASQAIPLNQAAVSATAGSSTIPMGSNSGARSASQASGSQLAVGQGSGGSAQSNPFDPATFQQYEKHKSGTSALFADALKGEGATLESGKKAAVYYRGWLTNGQMFDQSRAGADGNLEPFIFTLGQRQVVTGWEQALEGMKVGGVRLVIVPPSVGYGSTPQGSIPPDSVLVFQVQLAEVQ